MDKVLTPQEMTGATEMVNRILENLDAILLGQKALHRQVLIAILSRGHILLEGLPGVGKTAMVSALSELMQIDSNRVQFTPDLMPGDILGSHLLDETPDGKREMRFEAGPVFTNILLADEINRASPKTQSALLEAMQEGKVSLMGQTRPLPQPFFVLATQNPIELEGTYPLPEAQLDRFLFKLSVQQVNAQALTEIISTRRRGIPPKRDWHLEGADLDNLYDTMEAIFLPKPVAQYIARVTAASHPGHGESPEMVKRYVSFGASPRAAIAMAEAARGHALLAGRPTVGFEDVKAIAASVLNHRLILNYEARFDKVDSFTVVDALLSDLDEADITLPEDMEITTNNEKSLS